MQQTVLARSRRAQVRSVALRMAVGLAIGAALLLIFLHLVNLNAVYHQLAHLSVPFMVLAGFAFLGAYSVRAVRWRRLLRPCHVSIPQAVAIYQIATFLNLLLPVQGGEVAKSLLLRRSNGIPVSRSLATVSMDKTMDLLPAVALLLILPFTSFHLGGLLWTLLILALGVLGLTVGILALAMWDRDRVIATLTRSLAVILRGRARGRVEPSIILFVDTLLAVIRQPRVLLIAAAFTAAAAGLDALYCLFAFKTVGFTLPLSIIFYGYTLINLAFILPTPPAHVGFTQLIGLLVFCGIFHVNRPAVAAMFLLFNPYTNLLMACTGLFCLSRMRMSLRSVLRPALGPDKST